jgi:hypothetical protein
MLRTQGLSRFARAVLPRRSTAPNKRSAATIAIEPIGLESGSGKASDFLSASVAYFRSVAWPLLRIAALQFGAIGVVLALQFPISLRAPPMAGPSHCIISRASITSACGAARPHRRRFRQ